MDYIFLQHYWWFLISLLGALLVFLLFVQGANSLLFTLTHDESSRTLLINSTGRKWEFTFTTLVTFGGAFFASFPLFYSTSFGGAYWLWMIILFTFVLQAVSYEFQSKLGNFLGKKTYQVFIVINGMISPFLLGCAVATFFNGSAFFVDKSNIGNDIMPIISGWANNWHGIDALFNPWNVVLGLAVLFLSRGLGSLYLINNINNDKLELACRKQIKKDAVAFLIFFLAFIAKIFLASGFAVNPYSGEIYMEPYKYIQNIIDMPLLSLIFIVGVLAVLYGIFRGAFVKSAKDGIWFSGIGTVLTVLALLVSVGFNNTSYYPSSIDIQSSLTLANSCSSEFTLRTMFYVSLFIPVVLIYIFFAWRAMDRKQISSKELDEEEHTY
ncbi:cytochrome d ubiquinol oxidase subunit II [Phocaeicola paurosaccharolyticus]|uniref:cytochrome d ubiquinol oxidase subunit II n=1 Tax=Phocaeicola paurosaccharolyticus TaxID=732242 RepID=UPI00046962FE|nr:cytochrome d ubiquinol oxidase subunit II [Phocaeicola paurosaccharolyticus]